MDFLPFISSLVVATVAFYAIHANNGRADQRENKSWYRKLLLDNSVSFLNKMDVAQAQMADSHENYEDAGRSKTEVEYNALTVNKMENVVQELKVSATFLRLSCSPETEDLVIEICTKFDSAARHLSESFRLSRYATEPDINEHRQFTRATEGFEHLEMELLGLKGPLTDQIKADLAQGGPSMLSSSRSLMTRTRDLGRVLFCS